MTTPGWDASYTASKPAPWDIGRPQPAFVRLAERGLLSGRLLDAGCGTGEQTLLAASRGADAIGVDVSVHAIDLARGKAAERGLTARFEVADALRLGDLGRCSMSSSTAGSSTSSTTKTAFRYVASLASVLRDGGYCHLLCFSDRQPGTLGPRRIRQDELRAAFGDGWQIISIEAAAFELNESGLGIPSAQAWLATIQRVPKA